MRKNMLNLSQKYFPVYFFVYILIMLFDHINLVFQVKEQKLTINKFTNYNIKLCKIPLVDLQTYIKIYQIMQKGSLFLIGLLLASAIALLNYNTGLESPSADKNSFKEWKLEFGKNYKSDIEEKYRFDIFYKNLIMIKEHNIKYEAGQVLSKLKLNQFSDLTTQEFTQTYLSDHIPTDDFTCKGTQYPIKSTFNETFMTNKNMLTSVGQQGQCTSGYAFATSASVEASMFKTIGQIVQISSQQLVDCSKETSNNGCSGGNPLNALHYLINRGAMKSSDYPYTGKTDDCKYTPAKKIWEVETCTKVDNDLKMLKSQINQQPVIVGFDASEQTFIQHGAGLYTPKKCSTKINHYMLAVGWGQQTTGSLIKTTNYYIVVKNSFGMKWGDSGYGKIVVQENKKQNNACGMLTYAFFPFG